MPKDKVGIRVMLPNESLGHRTHRAPLHRRLTLWTCKVRAVLENSSSTNSKEARRSGPTAAACMPAA